MPTFFTTYCDAVADKAPLLFFATGAYLAILFLWLLILNPYQKQISKTSKAKRALKKCADGTRKNPAPLPKCYQSGWDVYKRSQNLLPSDCLAFPYKKPCFLFDLLGLLPIAATMPFCARAVSRQSFDWQFFVPLFFVTVFLIIFQTHRFLFLYRQNKAKKIHGEYLSLLDKLYQKGFYSPLPPTENQLLAQIKESSLALPLNKKETNLCQSFDPQKESRFISPHDRFFANANDGLLSQNDFDPVAPSSCEHSCLQQLNFLTSNGVPLQSAQSLCDLLQKSQNSPSPKVQKQLNELLNKTFSCVCEFKNKSA